jgi:hypothetical protein
VSEQRPHGPYRSQGTVVSFGGQKGESRQIIHSEVVDGILSFALLVTVGSLERDILPNGVFGFVIPDGHFDPVQPACEYWFICHDVFSFLKVVCFSFTQWRSRWKTNDRKEGERASGFRRKRRSEAIATA